MITDCIAFLPRLHVECQNSSGYNNRVFTMSGIYCRTNSWATWETFQPPNQLYIVIYIMSQYVI